MAAASTGPTPGGRLTTVTAGLELEVFDLEDLRSAGSMETGDARHGNGTSIQDRG
jgi:hypothetical protein